MHASARKALERTPLTLASCLVMYGTFIGLKNVTVRKQGGKPQALCKVYLPTDEVDRRLAKTHRHFYVFKGYKMGFNCLSLLPTTVGLCTRCTVSISEREEWQKADSYYDTTHKWL